MGGVHEPTLHELPFAYGITISLVSTGMLWLRCLLATCLFSHNKIAKTTCPQMLSKLSHILYLGSLIVCDLSVVHAWRIAPGNSASPPLLSWMAMWTGVNVIGIVMIAISAFVIAKAPIMWHTSCTMYALLCMSYLIDGIVRDDITAATMFAVPPVILGGFIVCYNSIHLVITKDVVRSIRRGHYGPDEQEDEETGAQSAGKLLTIKRDGKWETISTADLQESPVDETSDYDASSFDSRSTATSAPGWMEMTDVTEFGRQRKDKEKADE